MNYTRLGERSPYIDFYKEWEVYLDHYWGDPITQNALHWCRDNLGHPSYDPFATCRWEVALTVSYVVYRFKNKQDAVMFKLNLDNGVKIVRG